MNPGEGHFFGLSALPVFLDLPCLDQRISNVGRVQGAAERSSSSPHELPVVSPDGALEGLVDVEDFTALVGNFRGPLPEPEEVAARGDHVAVLAEVGPHPKLRETRCGVAIQYTSCGPSFGQGQIEKVICTTVI